MTILISFNESRTQKENLVNFKATLVVNPTLIFFNRQNIPPSLQAIVDFSQMKFKQWNLNFFCWVFLHGSLKHFFHPLFVCSNHRDILHYLSELVELNNKCKLTFFFKFFKFLVRLGWLPLNFWKFRKII